MLENFNYGNITDEHKAAALEIVNIARSTNNDMLAELIAHKFQLVEPVKYDIADSKFVQACETMKFNYWIQGWVTEGEDKDAVHYPIISITEDVRKLNTFMDMVK